MDTTTSIVVDDELWRRFKSKAVLCDKTVSSILAALIKEWVEVEQEVSK